MKWVLTFLMMFTSSFIFGQEEEKVKATINKLFVGMANADSLMVKSSFSENAILQSFNAKGKVQTEDLSKFASSISRFSKGDLDEQIQFETIKIDGNLAIAWTPYIFYFKQKFSHCGVNHFVLIKLNETWKIQYLIDTRRKDNCE